MKYLEYPLLLDVIIIITKNIQRGGGSESFMLVLVVGRHLTLKVIIPSELNLLNIQMELA